MNHSQQLLITGGAGFIGSNLAIALQKRGYHNLTIVDNFSSGAPDLIRGLKNINLIREDITNSGFFDKLKKERFEVIFHQAANTDTTYSNDKAMIFNNVESFRNVLNFAIVSGAKLIYASSAAVYGNGPIPMKEHQKLLPLNSYASSKCMIDKLAKDAIRERNISIIGLRYFNVYGPKEAHKGKSSSMIWQLSRTIKEKKSPRIFKYGLQARDFIYVKDVAEANIRAMESKERGIFNIGTGTTVTFNRIIEILNEIFGTSFQPDYFDNPYNFYQNHTQADTNLASKILKWKSRFSIEEGIKDYFNSIKKETL